MSWNDDIHWTRYERLRDRSVSWYWRGPTLHLAGCDEHHTRCGVPRDDEASPDEVAFDLWGLGCRNCWRLWDLYDRDPVDRAGLTVDELAGHGWLIIPSPDPIQDPHLIEPTSEELLAIEEAPFAHGGLVEQGAETIRRLEPGAGFRDVR